MVRFSEIAPLTSLMARTKQTARRLPNNAVSTTGALIRKPARVVPFDAKRAWWQLIIARLGETYAKVYLFDPASVPDPTRRMTMLAFFHETSPSLLFEKLASGVEDARLEGEWCVDFKPTTEEPLIVSNVMFVCD
jgi:hypothetical protein